MVKVWRTGGEEDKFLHKLNKQGKINKATTPTGIKKEFPHVFNDFSSNVIRNHLNDFKRRNGIYCKFGFIIIIISKLM